MATVRIDLEQRRSLTTHLQRLSPQRRSDDAVELTDSLVALHATDPATVFLSLACRSDHLTVERIEEAMYELRRLDRVLGMRRTLFVVAPELRPVIQIACTARIAATENTRLLKMMAGSEVGGKNPEAHLSKLKRQVLAALADQQPALGRDLAEAVGGLRQKVTAGSGESRTEVGMTTLVLSRMTMDGTIARTRPTGSWLSSQFRYELVESARGEPSNSAEAVTLPEASAVLLSRYLQRFGPATLQDCQWWTGWTKTQTSRAAEDVGATEVEVETGSGSEVHAALMMPRTLELLDGLEAVDPWVTFLPSLDATTMGFKQRDWYLGEGSEVLFDRFGNAGPTIWSGGRVIGGWGQRPDGTVAHRLVEEVGAEVAALAETEAARIEKWLDATVVSPRFRAPLERELSA